MTRDLHLFEDSSDDTPEVIDADEFILGAGVRLEVLGPLGAFAEVSRIAKSFESVSLGLTLGF